MSLVKGLTICCFFLLILTACADEEEVNYSGVFVSTSVNTTSVKMYTFQGEVKKKNSILSFLPNDIEKDYFIFADAPTVEGAVKIEFLNNDSVTVTENGHASKKVLTVKNGIMYLESLELGTILGGESGGFPLQQLYKYKPLYTDTSYVSAWSGYKYIVEVKECIYLEPSGNEIYLPLLSYYYKNSYVGGGYSTYAARSNNSLRNNSLKLLSATDTIVVQQCYIVLKKQ